MDPTVNEHNASDMPGTDGRREPQESDPAAVRNQMLLAMYSEMWANINRHITLVWQSVGVVVGTLAVVAFVGEEFLSIDVAISVIVVLAGWEMAHVIDASGWNNRNLYIIRNIERSFLQSVDSKRIHPYFNTEPRHGGMVEHLRIQFALGLAFQIGALVYHLKVRVWPDLPKGGPTWGVPTIVPYGLATLSAVVLIVFFRHIHGQYEQLVKESPGTEPNSG